MKKDEKKSIKKVLEKKKKTIVDYKWIITITTTAFLISLLFSFLSETIIPKVILPVGILILILVIVLGILFDIIGVAIQSAEEAPFHSMNTRKVKGAKTAILFKKNAAKVSSFCNDVIGDICGVISGTAGSIVALSLSNFLKVPNFLVILIVTALISALTIGGKAMGKSIAMNKSNEIIYAFAKIVSPFVERG